MRVIDVNAFIRKIKNNRSLPWKLTELEQKKFIACLEDEPELPAFDEKSLTEWLRGEVLKIMEEGYNTDDTDKQRMLLGEANGLSKVMRKIKGEVV